MEGMVMELYKNHVIVMTKSGEFLKLRKRGNVNIGDIYKENIYRRIPLITYAAAAALIFVFTSFAGYTAYANQIVGYVDIKGSKDVRLYVNRKGTVQKVDGLQNGNQIKNLPVYKAVEELSTIAPVEGIYTNSSEVDVSTTKVKDLNLDFDKVNENVKKILSEDNKSNDENWDKSHPDNSSKENKSNNSEKNNNGNKIKENKDKDNHSEQDNKDTENNMYKGKNKNDDNKDKDNHSEQDNKDTENGRDKGKNKNDDNKIKSDNENTNFYEFNKYGKEDENNNAGNSGDWSISKTLPSIRWSSTFCFRWGRVPTWSLDVQL